jgi:hypothetical protein
MPSASQKHNYISTTNITERENSLSRRSLGIVPILDGNEPAYHIEIKTRFLILLYVTHNYTIYTYFCRHYRLFVHRDK